MDSVPNNNNPTRMRSVLTSRCHHLKKVIREFSTTQRNMQNVHWPQADCCAFTAETAARRKEIDSLIFDDSNCVDPEKGRAWMQGVVWWSDKSR